MGSEMCIRDRFLSTPVLADVFKFRSLYIAAADGRIRHVETVGKVIFWDGIDTADFTVVTVRDPRVLAGLGAIGANV